MKEWLKEGETIASKYRVERKIGSGGMGVVIEATHLQLQQRVAIKLLPARGSPALRKRFEREARAAARLKSEHVAKVIDVGEIEAGGAPYMVMELLEGSDLAEELKRSGPFSVQDAVSYLLQVCEAVAEAHANGIIHRDLKPGNLFLTRTPGGGRTVKVLDFGIAKLVEDEPDEAETQLTRATDQLGTPSYMSPEQVKDAHEVDERSDIWALGVILYELVTGRKPFLGVSSSDIRVSIREDSPPPPSSLRKELPPQLDGVILRCLERKAAQRYQDVAALAKAIAPFAPRRARGAVRRIAVTLAHSRRGAAARAEAPRTDRGEDTAAKSALSNTLAPATAQRRARVASGAMVLLGVLMALGLSRWVHWDPFAPQQPLVVPASASASPESSAQAPDLKTAAPDLPPPPALPLEPGKAALPPAHPPLPPGTVLHAGKATRTKAAPTEPAATKEAGRRSVTDFGMNEP